MSSRFSLSARAGYTAMIVLSKIQTPKQKFYTDEISLEKLTHTDPSDLADVVFESNSDKDNSSKPKPKRTLSDEELDEYD